MVVESKVVLVLAGDSCSRDRCSSILGAASYTVLEADNGMEALLIAADKKGAIDLLLTEWNLPGIAGEEVARAFLMLWPDVNVLYLSGSPTENAGLQANQPSVCKPITPESLLNAVRQSLDASVAA